LRPKAKKIFKICPKNPIFDLFLANFQKILIKQRISRSLELKNQAIKLCKEKNLFKSKNFKRDFIFMNLRKNLFCCF